jgi:hypothetical protein
MPRLLPFSGNKSALANDHYNVGQLLQPSRWRRVNWGSVLRGALLGLFCYSGL